MQKKTLILTHHDLRKLLDISSALPVVEKAFAGYARGQSIMPPKRYLELKELKGDFRAMPAYNSATKRASLKWVNAHPYNFKHGLPSVMAVIILNDARTGFPIAIMDASLITHLRTGAAGGIAAKYLARKNSRVVACVGCGKQALTQIAALNEIFSIQEIRIWDISKDHEKVLASKIKCFCLKISRSNSIRQCVSGADIVVSTTPSRKAIIKSKWISPGTHVNAIGADAPGKQELDPRILKRAKIVIDSWNQAPESGEVNIPLKKGIIHERDIYATLGEVITKRKKGRTNNWEITVFDSTGLAIQDLALADLAYRKALKSKMGTWIKLLGV